MELDIANMFKEKNKDIFKNSLELEMERNLDTLIQTTDNAITLEINKIFTFLKEYLSEENLKYSEIDLKKIIVSEKETLNNLVNSQIESKKKELANYFQIDNKELLVIEDDYIKTYHDKINEITESIIEKIEIELRKEICTVFTPTILKKYVFKSEDQIMRIKGRIDAIFAETLIKRIKEEILFRDDSLKNMCQESYNKYLKLNEKTA